MPPVVPGTVTASSLRRTDPLWKQWDTKAQKEGSHHTVYWVSGVKYQGEWRDNKRHGKGAVVYKNGDKYEGDWENGYRHGLGTLWVFKSGKYVVRYHGEWEADLPTGHGTFYDDDGNLYDGNWLDGKRHGKGRAVYGGRPEDGFGGDVYEGHFEADQRHGKGTLMYANGDIYEGMWAFDEKHGEGSYFYMSKGKRFDGVWCEGSVRAGTYSEIVTSAPGTKGALPNIELQSPIEVLQTAVAEALQ